MGSPVITELSGPSNGATCRALAAALALVPGCFFAPINTDGRSCDAMGRCADGYVCEASTRECVRVGTDGGVPEDTNGIDSGVDGGEGDTAGHVTLTLTFDAAAGTRAGTGALITSTVGHGCGATMAEGCAIRFAPGPVTLSVAAGWLTVREWGGTACPPGGSCMVDVSTDTTLLLEPDARGNLAFVTRETFGPTAMELASAAAANAACQTRAASANLPGAIYRAALTTDVGDPWMALPPADRTRGWVRLDGLPIAHVGTSIETFQVHPLNIDETGTTIEVDRAALAWVAPNPMIIPGATMDEDAYRVGMPHATLPDSMGRNVPANVATPFGARLYCLQSPRSEAYALLPAPTVPTVPPVYLFVSVGTGSLGSRPALDARCASEALAAGLGDSDDYRALLGTTADGFLRQLEMHPRFTTAGVMVLRTDDYPLAPLATFATTNPLATTPTLHADGTTLSSATVATGAAFDDVLAGSDEDCSQWSDDMGSFSTQGDPWNATHAPVGVSEPMAYGRAYGSFAASVQDACTDALGLAVYCILWR